MKFKWFEHLIVSLWTLNYIHFVLLYCTGIFCVVCNQAIIDFKNILKFQKKNQKFINSTDLFLVIDKLFELHCIQVSPGITCLALRNAFYFTSKTIFFLEIFQF